MRETPPYIINLIDRENLDSNTVDITNFLSEEGYIRYLTDISNYFHGMKAQYDKTKKQMYYVAQYDFKAIKIGIALNPYDRVIGLQTGNPQKLILLYFYDPVEYNKDKNFQYNEKDTINDYEKKELNWLSMENQLIGEWFAPDNRAFRILIRHGLDVLEWKKLR